MSEIEIRYLKEKQKEISRPLYESCFPEDTSQFVDYYYKEKTKENSIAVLSVDGQIATMVHANPYQVSLCGSIASTSYIVAVATSLSFRRRGLMGKLLKQVLLDCRQKGESFSFLMPADPAYYESMGYRFWENQIVWSFAEDLQQQAEEWILLESDRIPEAIAFVNQTLSEQFDLFVQRDSSYFERLKKEQQSEGGDVALLQDETGRIQACFCYSTEDGFEIREPVGAGMKQKRKPLMMGRILDLEAFVLKLRFRNRFSDTILVTDPIIPENNGCFRICIDATGGNIQRVDEKEAVRVMDIAELGQILFGKIRIFINELV
jgi:hypothetical protein